MRVPALHLLTAFEAVARLESVSLAAKSLHLTTSAISHRLAKLEDSLGVRLFVRTREGMQLTSDGQKYNAGLKNVLNQFEDLSKCLDTRAEQSVVRVHAGPGFAQFWLMPRLANFRSAHPEIRIELSSSFKPVDFRKDPVDLWVQRGAPLTGPFVVENFMKEHFLPLASSHYIRKQKIRVFSDIHHASLIYCMRNTPAWPDWFKAKGLARIKLDWSLALSHADYAMQASAQGLGVVLESLELSEAFRRNKRLVPVFAKDDLLEGPGHNLVYPQEHLNSPAVASFRAWLYSFL